MRETLPKKKNRRNPLEKRVVRKNPPKMKRKRRNPLRKKRSKTQAKEGQALQLVCVTDFAVERKPINRILN